MSTPPKADESSPDVRPAPEATPQDARGLTSHDSAPAADDPNQVIESLVREPMGLETRDDLNSLVPALPATDFVQIARALADEQRLELLLPHADAAQLTGLLDLDAWNGDRVDVIKARFWLRRIVDHREDRGEAGQLAELIVAMDPEMWNFALLHGTAVAEVNIDDDSSRDEILDSMSALRTWEVPGGYYIVGVRDDEAGRMALEVLQAICADDAGTGMKLLQSIKYALPSQLEEDLLRWRSGRLADLGFPTWEQAMELFKPLVFAQLAVQRDEPPTQEAASSDNATDSTARAKSAAPEGHEVERVAWQPRGSVLARLTERMSPKQHGTAAREFSLLANELLIAQRLEPGDENHRHRALRQVEATLELGAEMALRAVGGPLPEQSVIDMLAVHGLRGLFRLAYGALAKLRKTARSLHRSGQASVSSTGSFLDKPWGPTLAQLSAWFPELPPRPRPANEARDQRGRKLPPPRPHTISSMDELSEATLLLAQAAALVRIAFDELGLGVDPVWLTRADDPGKLRIGDFIRTALIRRIVTGIHGTFGPLMADHLHRARTQLLADQGRLRNVVREELDAACIRCGVLEHAPALADILLTRLEVELAALEFDQGQVRLERAGGVLTPQQFSMWSMAASESN